MNQVKARSLKEVTRCVLLSAGSVIFLAVHTASHKNKNCSGSSDPDPLKIGSLISSARWAMVDLLGLGWGKEVDGEGFTGVDWPATGMLGLG